MTRERKLSELRVFQGDVFRTTLYKMGGRGQGWCWWRDCWWTRVLGALVSQRGQLWMEGEDGHWELLFLVTV